MADLDSPESAVQSDEISERKAPASPPSYSMNDLNDKQKKAVDVYLKACKAEDDKLVDTLKDSSTPDRLKVMRDTLDSFHAKKLDALLTAVAEDNKSLIATVMANKTKSGEGEYDIALVKAILDNGGLGKSKS